MDSRFHKLFPVPKCREEFNTIIGIKFFINNVVKIIKKQKMYHNLVHSHGRFGHHVPERCAALFWGYIPCETDIIILIVGWYFYLT